MSRALWFATVCIVACSPVKGKPLLDAEIVTVESVAVTPATVSTRFQLDAPTQMTAMATLSNGTTIDVTPDCMWTSAGLAAKVDGNGIVTPLAAGSTMISAAYEGQTGSAMVTVRLPVIVVGSITNPGLDFFPFDATGNVAPLRSIRGAATTLSFNWSIVVMPATNELYIANADTPTGIDVFPLDGTGNIAPTRTISGAMTGLTTAYGLQIDNNEIYTVQAGSGPNAGVISVFPQSGTGNIAPSRTITGAMAGLNESIGMALHNNKIFVANEASPGSITVYPESASGNVAPVQTIAGPLTQLSEPIGVMFVGDEMYVSDPGANAILVFPADATGNVAPTRSYRGPDSTLSEPIEMVRVGDQLLWVNLGTNSVSTAPLEVTSDTPPTAELTGALTNISDARGLAVF